MSRGKGAKPIRISYANAVSTLALIVALGTGGAYAASQITAGDIKKNAVRAKHIKKNQVKGKHIAPSQVGSEQIADGAFTHDEIACEGNSADDVMVWVGSVCIDKYENSIWTKKTGGTQITGFGEDIPCSENGQDCEDKIFARSVKGVKPMENLSWFQAQQALINSGKRLPTNAEWQGAVAGTPDGSPTPCHVDLSPGGIVSTGSAAGCVSDHGVNDMVGNVQEWVADWAPNPESDWCGSWPEAYGRDEHCLSGADLDNSTAPSALIRGGMRGDDSLAGPFALDGRVSPRGDNGFAGFRGAR